MIIRSLTVLSAAFARNKSIVQLIIPIIVIKPVTGRLPLAYIKLNECARSHSTSMTKWVDTVFTKRDVISECGKQSCRDGTLHGDHEREQGSPRGVYFSIPQDSSIAAYGQARPRGTGICWIRGCFSCGAVRIVGLEEKIIIFSRSVQDPEQTGLCQRKSLRCTDENDKTIWAGDAIVCIKKA